MVVMAVMADDAQKTWKIRKTQKTLMAEEVYAGLVSIEPNFHPNFHARFQDVVHVPASMADSIDLIDVLFAVYNSTMFVGTMKDQPTAITNQP